MNFKGDKLELILKGQKLDILTIIALIKLEARLLVERDNIMITSTIFHDLTMESQEGF